MADNLRSMDGRYFGRDADGYHRAFTGLKAPEIKVGASGSELSVFGANAVQALTSGSTGTQITAAGFTSIGSSLAKTYGMAAPVPGVTKTVMNIGGTTEIITVQLAAGTIQTTVGSSANKFTMDNAGNTVSLIGLSTLLYGLILKSTAVVLSTA